MGASGWEYVTPYEGTVEQSLAALHTREFQEFRSDDDSYESLEELWEDEEFVTPPRRERRGFLLCRLGVATGQPGP
ncbi:hypothetical protein AB5J56_40830 [Streptomyces sp. R21]|uniref:Uncharacterized protein n=1 Tax=Streptomyces sp. R21 TaxID=3238627 RepID=A0AB39PL81_9ACTN